MKRKNNRLALSLTLCGLVAVAAVLALPIQAASTSQTVIVGLNQFHNELLTLRDNLSTTMSALEALKAAAANNGDLTKPYESFAKSYAGLEAQADKVRQHGLAAKARTKELWEAWQKELTDMQNAKMREKAQDRFTATSKQFDRIVEKVAVAKEAFAPVMADLKDINTYFKVDLSQDAVSSLSSTIWKMGNKARSADSKLVDVCAEIDRTVKKMPQT